MPKKFKPRPKFFKKKGKNTKVDYELKSKNEIKNGL